MIQTTSVTQSTEYENDAEVIQYVGAMEAQMYLGSSPSLQFLHSQRDSEHQPALQQQRQQHSP